MGINWYISLNVSLYPKTIPQTNTAQQFMAGLLKYLQRCILKAAVYHKIHQGIRRIDGLIVGWTNRSTYEKGGIVKKLQQNPSGISLCISQKKMFNLFECLEILILNCWVQVSGLYNGWFRLILSPLPAPQAQGDGVG